MVKDVTLDLLKWLGKEEGFFTGSTLVAAPEGGFLLPICSSKESTLQLHIPARLSFDSRNLPIIVGSPVDIRDPSLQYAFGVSFDTTVSVGFGTLRSDQPILDTSPLENAADALVLIIWKDEAPPYADITSDFGVAHHAKFFQRLDVSAFAAENDGVKGIDIWICPRQPLFEPALRYCAHQWDRSAAEGDSFLEEYDRHRAEIRTDIEQNLIPIIKAINGFNAVLRDEDFILQSLDPFDHNRIAYEERCLYIADDLERLHDLVVRMLCVDVVVGRFFK